MHAVLLDVFFQIFNRGFQQPMPLERMIVHGCMLLFTLLLKKDVFHMLNCWGSDPFQTLLYSTPPVYVSIHVSIHVKPYFKVPRASTAYSLITYLTLLCSLKIPTASKAVGIVRRAEQVRCRCAVALLAPARHRLGRRSARSTRGPGSGDGRGG